MFTALHQHQWMEIVSDDNAVLNAWQAVDVPNGVSGQQSLQIFVRDI
jgi:hypothetical protein